MGLGGQYALRKFCATHGSDSHVSAMSAGLTVFAVGG